MAERLPMETVITWDLQALRQRTLELEGKIAAGSAEIAELSQNIGREMSSEEAKSHEAQRVCMETLREGLLRTMESERRELQLAEELSSQLEKCLKLHLDDKGEQATLNMQDMTSLVTKVADLEATVRNGNFYVSNGNFYVNVLKDLITTKDLQALREHILELEGKIAAHSAEIALSHNIGRGMPAEEAELHKRWLSTASQSELVEAESEDRQLQVVQELLLQGEKHLKMLLELELHVFRRLKLHLDDKGEQAPAVNGITNGEEEPPAAPKQKAGNKEVVGEKEVVVKQEIVAAASPMKRAADFGMPAAKRPATKKKLK